MNHLIASLLALFFGRAGSDSNMTENNRENRHGVGESEPIKKPGERWRILAHDGHKTIEVENQGIFDELVVDEWLHIEQMDDNVWWIRAGDARILVTISGNEPPIVDIQRDFYGREGSSRAGE